MKVEYINCEACWKLIQKRNQRTLCIACTNARSKEMAAARRNTVEYKEHYKQRHEKRMKGE